MENTTKILTYLFCLTCLVCLSCKAKSEKPNFEADIVASGHGAEVDSLIIKYPDPPTISLGNGLFTDSTGKIYLKVKNRRLPRFEGRERNRPDSIFLSSIELANELRELSSLIHRASFRRIDAGGYYFADSQNIYVYTSIPYSNQFYSLPNRNPKFIGSRKEYLLVDGRVYYCGIPINGLDFQNLKIMKMKADSPEKFVEFLTDGKVYIYGRYPLDSAGLAEIKGLSQSDRKRLRKHLVSAE